jgi:KaiC/GvpD/RAD55 family RecA-like ATPase
MKVPTGLRGLDALVEGGFDKGSLIVVSGGAGTGKTILSSIMSASSVEFLEERVLYVSFGESRKNLIETLRGLAQRRLPPAELDRRMKEVLSSGRLHILDMATFADGAESTVLNSILQEVVASKPSKLVIDPFTVLFRDSHPPNELRAVLHDFFGKILRENGCTTILVAESTPQVRPVTEEFVADGIITLDRIANNGRTLRTISISKMRKTAIQKNLALFSLHSGFRIFKPFSVPQSRKIRRFAPVPDTDSYFSSGSPDMDKLLDGGFRKGSTVLIESGENVSVDAFANIITVVTLNALANGNLVTGIPFASMSSRTIRGMIQDYVDHRILENNLKIFDYGRVKDRISARMSGEFGRDQSTLFRVLDDFGKRGKPIIKFFGVDNLEYRYEEKNILAMLALDVSRTASHGGLSILFAKPDLKLTGKYVNMSTSHIRLESHYGTVVVHGVTPWTGNHVLQLDFSNGNPQLQLEPVM